jgi:hypothetical protein
MGSFGKTALILTDFSNQTSVFRKNTLLKWVRFVITYACPKNPSFRRVSPEFRPDLKWVRLVKRRLSTDFEDFRRLFLTTKNTKKNANGRTFLTQKTRETLYSYFLRHRLTPIFTDSKRAKDASTPLNHKPRTVAHESIGNLKNSFWRTSETFRFWTASGKSRLSFG